MIQHRDEDETWRLIDFLAYREVISPTLEGDLQHVHELVAEAGSGSVCADADT